MHLTHTQKHKTRTRGFTLVELMVTITVMLIITSIALFNYQQFNSVTTVTSLAYDMSLVFRQAQVYGLSVREYGSTGSNPGVGKIDVNNTGQFGAVPYAYGVHFDPSMLGDGAASFALFVDVNRDSKYTAGGTEDLEKFKLPVGTKISSVCQYTYTFDGKTGNQLCVGSSGLGYIDVMFKRPNPETLVGNDKGVAQLGHSPLVVVTLSSLDDSIKKAVFVEPTGQISVKDL